ncbi:hypothetical protein [Ensifer soli]|uniref:hypothetical protein n=1 Tax=Ciceribacter sp. sgz301302 TaxID=3342379 RepID=UPI0035BB174C
MSSRRSFKRKGAKRPRPYAHEKLAFAQDLESDPTLSSVQKGLIGTIAKNFDNQKGSSACSLTFMANATGTTKKVVSKYLPAIVRSGRVSILQKGAGTAPTLWDVFWWFRGSGWVRAANGGKPILDCRDLTSESPRTSPLASPKMSPQKGDALGDAKVASVPQVGDQTLLFPLGEIKGTHAPAPGHGLAAGPAQCGVQKVLSMVIVAAEVATADGDTTLTVILRDVSDGIEHEDNFIIESASERRQVEGQRRFEALRHAADIDDIDDASDLIGLKLDVLDGIDFTYLPAHEVARRAYLPSAA